MQGKRSHERSLLLRSFYNFHMREKRVSENVFTTMFLPKNEGRLPTFLYEEEIQELFASLIGDKPLDQRDRAILELLYATGIRVSECSQANNTVISISPLGQYLSLVKEGRNVIYPMGSFAADALTRYIQDGRESLLKKGEYIITFSFSKLSWGSPF